MYISLIPSCVLFFPRRTRGSSVGVARNSAGMHIYYCDSWPYAKQFPLLWPTVINYLRERERETEREWEKERERERERESERASEWERGRDRERESERGWVRERARERERERDRERARERKRGSEREWERRRVRERGRARERERYIWVVWEFKGKMFYFTQTLMRKQWVYFRCRIRSSPIETGWCASSCGQNLD